MAGELYFKRLEETSKRFANISENPEDVARIVNGYNEKVVKHYSQVLNLITNDIYASLWLNTEYRDMLSGYTHTDMSSNDINLRIYHEARTKTFELLSDGNKRELYLTETNYAIPIDAIDSLIWKVGPWIDLTECPSAKHTILFDQYKIDKWKFYNTFMQPADSLYNIYNIYDLYRIILDATDTCACLSVLRSILIDDEFPSANIIYPMIVEAYERGMHLSCGKRIDVIPSWPKNFGKDALMSWRNSGDISECEYSNRGHITDAYINTIDIDFPFPLSFFPAMHI